MIGSSNLPRKLNDTKNPIFILGLSRSGTTLFSRILDKHPNISIYMETNFLNHIWEKRDEKFINNEKEFEDIISKVSHLDREGVDINAVREKFFKTNRHLMALFDAIIQVKMEKNHKKRFGEKTPSKNILHLDTLLEYYPGANLIFIFRDPRNNFSSFKSFPFYKDKSINFIKRTVFSRALFWNRFFKILDEQQRKLPQENYRIVKFENLVQNPRDVVRSICDFLKEEYYDEMLDVDNLNTYFNDSKKKKGIQKNVLDRWKHLRIYEIISIELICGKNMLERSYPFLVVPPFLIELLIRLKYYQIQNFIDWCVMKLKGLFCIWRFRE